jgi:hypothetical protein
MALGEVSDRTSAFGFAPSPVALAILCGAMLSIKSKWDYLLQGNV